MSRLLGRLLHELKKLPLLKDAAIAREISLWMRTGKKGPTPHAMKQANLKRLAAHFSIPTLVESGTCRADMMIAMRNEFAELYSIELSEPLFQFCKRRCAPFRNIHLKNGDSGTELQELCSKLTGNVLFWLDGHYSGGDTALGTEISPILAELNAIDANPQITPFIIIDDARLFKTGTGYPTMSQMFQRFANWHIPMNTTVMDDAIVSVPEAILINSGEGKP